MIRHPLLTLLLGGLLVLALTVPSRACPFCSQAGRTLLEEVNDAEMVIYGSFKKPQLGGDGVPDTTDFDIESVVKKHDAIAGKKTLTLERFVPDKGKDKRWLVFCSIFKGKIDPYMAQLVSADSGIDKYLIQALKYQDRKKEPAKRLRFFFDYLDNAEPDISNDALKEWSLADYQDYRDLAKDLPAEKLAKWLTDKNTAEHRIGLYASLLGHCGKKEDADLLRGMLDDPTKRVGGGLDGILAGYVLLDPKNGWKLVHEWIGTPSLKFGVRYAVLRTARFFWDNRTDVIKKEEIVSTVCQLLDQSDIADLAMEDLRKRGAWSPLEKVLQLYGLESHNIPIIRRAILRYALSVPPDQDTKGLAKAFVEKLRKEDPDRVQQAEDLLRDSK